MRSLVKKRSKGMTLVEVVVSIAISSVVALVASVPVLDYSKKSKKSTEAQVVNFIESDLFYFLSLPNICEATLAGRMANVAENLVNIRRPLPGGGFENIVTTNQPVHPLSDMYVANISKRAWVNTGTREGLVGLDFDIRSNQFSELNRVRNFVVKVFTDSTGAIEKCTRSTDQDLTLFCDSFGGVIDGSGNCANVAVAGNSNIQNMLIAESTLSASGISTIVANAVAGITTTNLNLSGGISISGGITGTGNISIGGGSSMVRLVSTDRICRGGNCRRFNATNCGSSRYIRRINSNGTATCQNRPW